MKKDDIETIIRGHVRQNFIGHPTVFPDTIIDILTLAKDLAQGYWDHRTNDEIKRDAEANFTFPDYYSCVVGEMTLIKHQMLYN